MKNFNTTIAFILTLFISGLTYAQTCNADATINTTGNPGEVEIIDNSTTPSGAATTYSWVDFYEANTWNHEGGVYYIQPNSTTATYQFTENGTYNYYISVQDSITNCYDSIGGTITINNIPVNCDASFSYYDTVNNQTYFYPNNYDVNLEYAWDFGDGNYSSDPYAYHTYSAPGTYTACLIAWDNAGSSNCADTICQTVTISNTNTCDASFSFEDTLNNETYFYPNNYDSNLEYSWDFGDGNYSSNPYAYHTYSAPGTYTACLIAWDPNSGGLCADTICQTVTITNTTSCDANFSYYDTINNQTHFYPNNYDADLYYSWDFGDGNYSNIPSPYHTYNSPGTYTVCLTVWDNSGGLNCADTVCQTVTINNTTFCNAGFSYYDTTNNQTYFYPIYYDADLEYSWDFGDGNYSNDPYPYHIYNSPGTYTVCLIAWDPNSGGLCADTACATISISASNYCDASFDYLDTTNGQNYFIPDNYYQNYSYYWDFGDGNTSTDPFPTHTYSSPGTYTACLNVWEPMSGGQCADTVCQTITVTNNSTSCAADFYLFQDSTNSNMYYIWDLSYGNNLSYSWDFGDGTVSNQQYPTHTYTTQGIFTICLTITDNTGNCSDQYCQTIEVLNKAQGTTINVVPFGQTADLAEESNIISDVKLFPNPSSSFINITLRGNVNNDYDYQIVDVMGNQIELGQLDSNQNVASKEINVEQLQQGVYFVQIIESSKKEKVKTLKFIKK